MKSNEIQSQLTLLAVKTYTTMHDLIPLTALRPGQIGQVEQVLGAAGDVQRLKELGLCDGASIEMVQAGSPCIVRLAGHKMCFRGGELLSVLVRMES